ncbi:MAG: putative zinc-binding protein [Euryarchaeota archaeon]|uniref:putative zinc-binding protein n=1 Tax=Methanobacterium sp. MZD130B TaxID=3394378 RepID=UPI001763E16B|nr:putative zinc-binding protein [Euryarchaeota archaeon]HHT18004.1 zinc-binding protein [Methanobacterium sp.]
MKEKKLALAPCSGMSPHGLITRVVCSDMVEKSDKLISICMGATSADKEGFGEIIKKFPILAVNGCDSSCVDKILKQKGVIVAETINVLKIVACEGLKPTKVSRLDEEGERCVILVKKKINQIAIEKDC